MPARLLACLLADAYEKHSSLSVGLSRLRCYHFPSPLIGGGHLVRVMKSGVSAEELARIAGVKAATVRKIAHELLELLEQDVESRAVAVGGVIGS
jgi:hypothetical protein